VLRVSVSVGETLIAGLPGQTAPIQFLPRAPKLSGPKSSRNGPAWSSGPMVDIEDDHVHGPVWKAKSNPSPTGSPPNATASSGTFMLNDVQTWMHG